MREDTSNTLFSGALVEGIERGVTWPSGGYPTQFLRKEILDLSRGDVVAREQLGDCSRATFGMASASIPDEEEIRGNKRKVIQAFPEAR